MQRKQRTNKHTPNYEHRPEETARRSPSPKPTPTTPTPPTPPTPPTTPSPSTEEQNLPMRKQSQRHRSATQQLDTRNRPARATVLELQLNEQQAAKTTPREGR